MRYLLALSALLLLVVSAGNAQMVAVDHKILANEGIVDSEVDSVMNIPLEYNGLISALRGIRPDSMRLEWTATATGDSTLVVYQTAINAHGAGYTAWASKDSVIGASETAFWLFPRSTYSNADLLGVKVIAADSANSLTGGNALWLYVRQFYTLPK